MTGLPGPRSEFVDKYLRDTLFAMMDLFKISEYEATGRISKVLGSWDLSDPQTENILGHEDAEYWAHLFLMCSVAVVTRRCRGARSRRERCRLLARLW